MQKFWFIYRMCFNQKINILTINDKKCISVIIFLFFIFNVNLLFSSNHFAENQSRISRSSFPETDGNLAISPTDQNNLGFISIQHRNTQNKDNFLVPIHYSTNRGASWQLNNFVFIPNLEYTFLAGASSPVISFSSEGICVAAVIHTLFDKISNDKTEVTQIITWAKSTNGGKNWTYSENNILSFNKDLLDYSKPNDGLGRVFSCLDIESVGRNRIIISSIENSNGEEKNSRLRLFEIDLNDDNISELPSKIISIENPTISDIYTDYSENTLHFIFIEQNGIYANYYLSYSFDKNKFSEKVKISDYYLKNTEHDEDYFPNKFNSHPSLVSSTNNQKIYCSWNASGINKASNNQKIFISTSNDLGLNWSDPEQISPPASDCFYSNIDKSGDSLIISYLEKQKKESTNTNIVLVVKNEEEKSTQRYVMSDYSGELAWENVDNFSYKFGKSNRCEIGEDFYGLIWPFVSSEQGNIDYKFNLFPLGQDFEKGSQDEFQIFVENPISEFGKNINIILKVLERTKISLKLFDLRGKLEFVLYYDEIQVGEYYFTIEKKDFPSGMKILYCRGKKMAISKKLIVK